MTTGNITVQSLTCIPTNETSRNVDVIKWDKVFIEKSSSLYA